MPLFRKLKHDPTIIDPSQPGPFDVCLRCFTPKSQEFGFCKKCGHMFGYWDVPEISKTTPCARHPRSNALYYCSLCGDPICKDCFERQGYDLFLSHRPINYCKRCLRTMEETEKSFFHSMKATNRCSKHHNISATAICKKCGLPHCDRCLYYTDDGFTRPNIGQGPFCLVCFRLSIHAQSRKYWLSAYEARDRKLLWSPFNTPGPPALTLKIS